jgi:1-acyl-sn-glycerol-3-phosphate acyltransferase
MKRLSTYPNPLLRSWHFQEGVSEPTIRYCAWRRLCQVFFSAFWGVRAYNRRHEPATGSVLYICNHQSYLDPPLMGLALRRPMNYMARDSLFRNWFFGRLIRSVNAFPVKRASADTGALKEALRRLKAGGQLVVFPEGTRTGDGRIGQFLPGVSMLARRAADWVVPTLIEGAFECWRRTQLLPGPGQVFVLYGQPLGRQEIESMDARELINTVRARLVEMQRELREHLGRPRIVYHEEHQGHEGHEGH